jgi:hypothetical protein
MRMRLNRILPVLAWVLVLAKEGRVSGGVEAIALADLIARSDAILLVKKDVPYAKVEKLPLPSPAQVPFQAASRRYRVLKVIRDAEGRVKGKRIQVFAAHVEDNYEQTRRELEGKPAGMIIQPAYRSEGSDPEKDPRFIIFVRYDRDSQRFSFAADGALEKAAREQDIKSLAQGNPPPVPD